MYVKDIYIYIKERKVLWLKIICVCVIIGSHAVENQQLWSWNDGSHGTM